jgi:invasion protein IalB
MQFYDFVKSAAVLIFVADGVAHSLAGHVFGGWTVQCDPAAACVLSQASIAQVGHLLSVVRSLSDAAYGAVIDPDARGLPDIIAR